MSRIKNKAVKKTFLHCLFLVRGSIFHYPIFLFFLGFQELMEGLEKEEALKCVGLAVFHDNPETRIGDIDKLMARYLDMEKIISETYPVIIAEQTNQLPGKIAEEIADLIREANLGESREAIIVRDADILERAVQSKIYAEGGYRLTKEFFSEEEEAKLKTETARKLMSLIRQKRNLAIRWRKGLKME